MAAGSDECQKVLRGNGRCRIVFQGVKVYRALGHERGIDEKPHLSGPVIDDGKSGDGAWGDAELLGQEVWLSKGEPSAAQMLMEVL